MKKEKVNQKSSEEKKIPLENALAQARRAGD